MLNICDLQATAGDFVLGPVTHDFRRGITSIIGPNGSGKTTLFTSLVGDGRVDSGTVMWNGSALGHRDFGAWHGVSYIPDSSHTLFDEMTSEETWAMAARVQELHRATDTIILLEEAFSLAEKLGFSEFDKRTKNLSLGNRKKSRLICGLMNRPSLLLVDEQQNGLDFLTSIALRAQLQELVRDEGSTVVMSNHDLDSVARSSDEILALRGGRLVEAIRPAESGLESAATRMVQIFTEFTDEAG